MAPWLLVLVAGQAAALGAGDRRAVEAASAAACSGPGCGLGRTQAHKALQTKVVFHLRDCDVLNFATEARIYPEAPDLAYVTKRGWVGCKEQPERCPQGGEQGPAVAPGLTVVNISDPRRPRVVHQWHSQESVEGQDRLGDLLVVASLARGGLFTFDASGTVPRLLAFVDIPNAPSTLHVRLHRGAAGKVHAFLTQGWCDDSALMGCDLHGFSRVHSVDVTDPRQPTAVGTVHSGVPQPEGISVNGDYLYIGGIESDKLAVVNITDPARMRVVCSHEACATLTKPYYNQMVGEFLHDGPDGAFNAAQGRRPAPTLWAAALWGRPGGVGVFDVRDAAFPRQIGLALHPDMARANRVHMHRGRAVIPLEQDPAGGFAVVDLREPTAPRYLGAMLLPPDDTRVYALVVKENVTILLAARTCELYAVETAELN